MTSPQREYTYEPRLLRHTDVERYIWGDDASGHVVDRGETLHFRKETWHYGYNFGAEQVLIVAAFAPLPDDLTAAAELAGAATPMDHPRGGRYELLGNWPWNADEAERDRTVRVMRRPDWLHLIHGDKSPVRVSLFLSTERLTMGLLTLPPGTVSDPETHPGDEVAFVAEGSAHVFFPESLQVFDMHRLDATYIPGGVSHRYINEGH